MSAQKPTVTSATIERYANVFRRLFVGAETHSGLKDPFDIIDWMIADTVRLKPTRGKSTFRQYKAAIMYSLGAIIPNEKRSPAQKARLVSARERMASESSTGGLRKPIRTSAKKSRSVGESDFEVMRTHLLDRAGQDYWAKAALSAMYVLHLSGLRPGELSTVHLFEPEPGMFFMRVVNAKSTNGRGNGDNRTLEFRGLAADEATQLRAWPFLLEEFSRELLPLVAIARISKYFGRATAKALPKRAKHVTLYSFRHQFTADCKRSGVSESDRAAMLGHGSNATANKHYGRCVAGKTGVKAKADPAESAKVRHKARRFPGRGSGPAPAK